MKKHFFLLAALLWSLWASAQQATDSTRLFAAINQIQDVYAARPVAFNIRYTWSGEAQPGINLDSLAGEVSIDGDNIRCRLNEMETISNARYNIILFKEDKVMYLSTASSLLTRNPILQMRSMLQNGKVRHFQIEESGMERTIIVSMADASPCKSIEMNMDKTTGYVSSIQYVMKTDQLAGMRGEEEDEDLSATGKYAVVTVQFSDYKKNMSGPERFDERQFFYREGNELKTTAAYSDYSIFKGSPNL